MFGMLPVLFVWDAYLMSGRGDRVSFVTHEGFVCTLSRDEQSQRRHVKDLARWKPEIQPIPPWA